MNDDKFDVPRPVGSEDGETVHTPAGPIVLFPNATRRLSDALLGATDEAGQFKDRNRMVLNREGLAFTVWQNSLGATGVDAESLEGFSLESLVIDEVTQKRRWQKEEDGKSTSVMFDRGKMSQFQATEPILQAKLAEPGWRAGIVRVTNKTTQGKKAYFLGGQFSGRPDRWSVSRTISELQFGVPPK